MFQTILLDIAPNGIATVTLSRPEVYNAINKIMLEELKTAIGLCETRLDIKVIVLTGEGKAFCAGQDLKSLSEDPNIQPKEMVIQYYNPLIMDIRNCSKPIICKLNGVASGAGCSLALACDMVIASDTATLSEAFINIGLVPDSGSTYFLPRIVGRMKAFELLALGNKISAAEALQLGLVNQVVSPGELDQYVWNLASKFAVSPSKSIAMIKSMLNKSYHNTLSDVLEMEALMQEKAASTDDFKEGVRAFMEKRTPNYKGH